MHTADRCADLTDGELLRYQRELERSLAGLPADAPVRDLIHERLLAVLAEQTARADGGRRP